MGINLLLVNFLTWFRKAIDFSQRPKILKMVDEDPKLSLKLDAEQLVRDLKQLDPNRWDPLPVNVK